MKVDLYEVIFREDFLEINGFKAYDHGDYYERINKSNVNIINKDDLGKLFNFDRIIAQDLNFALVKALQVQEKQVAYLEKQLEIHNKKLESIRLLKSDYDRMNGYDF